MTARPCIVCGQDLRDWTRADKTTCGSACRNRLYRTRKASCDTFATPLRAVAPRSGGGEGREPVGSQIAPPGASATMAMFPKSGTGSAIRVASVVHPDRLIRVLAEGLLAIEKRRAGSQTELPNRAMIVAPRKEGPIDEPAREP